MRILFKKLTHTSSLQNLAEGYWVEGVLVRPVEIGHPVVIARYNRNGVKAYGILTTSPVIRIEQCPDSTHIYTQNSIYELRELCELQKENN